MKVLLCLAFLLAAAVAQKCFDEDLVRKEVIPRIEKYKESIGSGLDGLDKEARHEKIGEAFLKDEKMLTADDKLDYDKYKKWCEKYTVEGMQTTVFDTMDKVWADAKQDCKVFFKNLNPELKKVCTEDKFECEDAI